MRAIWSGEITFGLVNVPVKLYSATRSHDISFHQVHDDDNGRIRYERRCDVCGRQIDYEHIDKAYDDGDKTVVLSDEELDALPADESEEIEVVQFVPGDQIDPILLGTAYLLEPVGKSPKAYVLLRRTLESTDRTAVVTFTLRSKTRLGVLSSRGTLLTLQTMRWPEDVQEVDFAPSGSRVSQKELKMAGALVEQFSGDFEPEQFSDDYQEQLRELIDDKLEHGEAVDTEETFGRERAEKKEQSQEGGKVVSLMDALERSLQGRRDGGARGGDAKNGGRDRTESGAGKSGDGKGDAAKGATRSSGGAKGGTTKSRKGRAAERSGSSTKSA